ncbi:AAA family ATPase [Candidatus Woesearchaeota archaeon]|nr:AAA family ATPase [Candidatus Woesearchaeota archaeon]
MSYLIIIRGPLGVGKSTVAKKLARSIKGKYVSVDELLAKHGLDNVDRKEGCIPLKNFIRLNEIILPEIKSFLAKGTDVVVDGNFYHKAQIEHLINSILPNKSCVFTLTASLNDCIQRDKSRKKCYGAKATRAVYELVSKVNYGKKVLTSGKTADQIVKKIISLQ